MRMRVSALSALAVSLTALLIAGVADAQYGGGGGGGYGGGGGGGGHHGGHGNRSQDPASSSAPPPSGPAPENPANRPMSQVEIAGVVKAVDPAQDRVTIAYGAVQALNWPPGTMPFVVAHAALLKDVSVGEAVRFKLESQQISELRPAPAPRR